MVVEQIVKKIEKDKKYKVLDIYDFDSNSYLVTCENLENGSRDSDYFYLVNKSNEKVSGYNPAADPFEYAEKIEKAEIVYSK